VAGAALAAREDQVGAGEHEPADARLQGGVGQAAGRLQVGPADLVGVGAAQDGRQVHDRVPPGQRGTVAARVEQIGQHRLGAGGFDMLGGDLAADHRPDVVTLGDQARQHVAADAASRAGEQQLHGPHLLVTARRALAARPRVARAAAARKDVPIQGLLVPGWPGRARA
jgi:hypothetical protein